MVENHKQRKKKELKDLYLQLKKRERQGKKEYMTFSERLMDASSLTGDFVGDLLISMPGKNSVIVRNFFSVVEYTSDRIRIKSKKYELCVEGKYLRFSYFFPEELLIAGDIQSLSFPKKEH